MRQQAYFIGLCGLGLFVAMLAVSSGAAVSADKPSLESFSSPELAAVALIKAARANKRKAIIRLLGKDAEEWIQSGDEVQDRQGREAFIAAYDKKHGIELDGDDFATLVVGDDDFPFPIPIVKSDGGWVFDAEEGKEEILNRRIGRNELDTIQTLLAVADAQFDYAQEDRDGDGLREYATRFLSTEGERDGLFWPTQDGEPPSPLGELVADATSEGYTAQNDKERDDDETGAYHGYRFKLMQRQGQNAQGGAFEYLVDGSQIGGFAVLAYPAKYGNSGIMTFMISHDGVVYQADLGEETDSVVASIDSFDPGPGWGEVEPEDMQTAEESSAKQ